MTAIKKLKSQRLAIHRVVGRDDESVAACIGAAIDHHTFLWWALLSSISLVNIAAWIYSYLTLEFDYGQLSSSRHHDHPYQRHHLVLSGIYVFVCAYRSFLPRIDLERYCLWDTVMSSIFLGRSAATIAELAFSAQISLFLYHLGLVHDHVMARYLAVCLVPVIAVAQAFCWFGVVTLNHVYHAVEESLWAISAVLVGCVMCSFAVYHPENSSLFLLGVVGAVGCFAFFVYMVTCDVPMYLRRWREGKRQINENNHKKKINRNNNKKKNDDIDENKNRTKDIMTITYMPSFSEGGKDAMQRRVVTKSWDVWREESVWLTGYFSSAVWLSLLLVHMPTPV